MLEIAEFMLEVEINDLVALMDKEYVQLVSKSDI